MLKHSRHNEEAEKPIKINCQRQKAFAGMQAPKAF